MWITSISCPLPFHVGNFKSAMVGIFTPGKWKNAGSPDFSQEMWNRFPNPWLTPRSPSSDAQSKMNICIHTKTSESKQCLNQEQGISGSAVVGWWRSYFINGGTPYDCSFISQPLFGVHVILSAWNVVYHSFNSTTFDQHIKPPFLVILSQVSVFPHQIF